MRSRNLCKNTSSLKRTKENCLFEMSHTHNIPTTNHTHKRKRKPGAIRLYSMNQQEDLALHFLVSVTDSGDVFPVTPSTDPSTKAHKKTYLFSSMP